MPIGKNVGNCDAYLHRNLIVMSIYGQALHRILFGHLNARIVLVQCQVHVLHRCRMVAMLWRSGLVLILRHCELLLLLWACSCSLTLISLINLLGGSSSGWWWGSLTEKLVKIHEILKFRNALEQLLDAIRYGVHLGLLVLLLLLMLLRMVCLLTWSALHVLSICLSVELWLKDLLYWMRCLIVARFVVIWLLICSSFSY